MTDLIARAEAALEGRWPGDRVVSPARFFGLLVSELVDALKAEQAANDDLTRKLKALHGEQQAQYERGEMHRSGIDID